jgi:undecaprenyl-diphosphatase
MDIFEAILLGAVQGITEFLPVSSSGHLVLLQKILGISEPALFFDTMVHVGTLAAVFVVLWQDIWALLRRPLQPLTGYLLLATLPTVIVALFFKDPVEAAFQSGTYLGWAFLFTAGALLVAERLSKRPGFFRGERDMNWIDALVIGLCQGAAIMPAVSRSGLTLSGALSRKLDRSFAARFSFLLSIPAILGALVLQLKDLLNGEEGMVIPGSAVEIIAGTATAAVVGFFAVTFMLKLVRERSLRGFAIYVAILGGLVLVDQRMVHLFF